MTKKTPSKKHGALDAKKSSPWMRQHPIGDALRDSYNAVLEEPVPEKFKSLMEMMRKAETKR